MDNAITQEFPEDVEALRAFCATLMARIAENDAVLAQRGRLECTVPTRPHLGGESK